MKTKKKNEVVIRINTDIEKTDAKCFVKKDDLCIKAVQLITPTSGEKYILAKTIDKSILEERIYKIFIDDGTMTDVTIQGNTLYIGILYPALYFEFTFRIRLNKRGIVKIGWDEWEHNAVQKSKKNGGMGQ